jgi:hypothetical protein
MAAPSFPEDMQDSRPCQNLSIRTRFFRCSATTHGIVNSDLRHHAKITRRNG